MNTLNEQSLDELLNQPMPAQQSEDFREKTWQRYAAIQQIRWQILLLFSLVATVCLIYFLPVDYLAGALSSLILHDINSLKYILVGSGPLLLVMLVGFFICEDSY